MAYNIQGFDRNVIKADIQEFRNSTTAVEGYIAEIELDLDYCFKNGKMWSGKRANSVITLWNSMVDKFNENINFLLEINDILTEIQNQYITMEDQGKATDISDDFFRKRKNQSEKLPLTDPNVVRFNSTYQFKLNYEPAIKGLDNAENSLNKLSKYSDSLAQLRNTYISKIAEIKNNIKTLCNTLQTEITNERNVIIQTEEINAKDASRKS